MHVLNCIHLLHYLSKSEQCKICLSTLLGNIETLHVWFLTVAQASRRAEPHSIFRLSGLRAAPRRDQMHGGDKEIHFGAKCSISLPTSEEGEKERERDGSLIPAPTLPLAYC